MLGAEPVGQEQDAGGLVGEFVGVGGDDVDAAPAGGFEGLSDGVGGGVHLGDELVHGAVGVGLDAQAEDVATVFGECGGEGGQTPRSFVDGGADPHECHVCSPSLQLKDAFEVLRRCYEVVAWPFPLP